LICFGYPSLRRRQHIYILMAETSTAAASPTINDTIITRIKAKDFGKCNSDENVAYLRDILSNLHYYTFTCELCDWVDHYENKHRCTRCDDFAICDACWTEIPTKNWLCENCQNDDGKDNNSQNTSDD
jgi:hypothetical protein